MQRNVRRYALAYLEAAEESDHKSLPELTRRFIAGLTRRRQRRLLPKIMAALPGLWNERHGITAIRVTTAAPIDAALLTKTFGQEADVTASVEPALIGGAIVDRDDTRIDGSVRSALTRLHTALARKE